MSIIEKYDVIQFRESNPTISIEKIAEHFKYGRSTVSEILGKQKSSIIQKYNGGADNVNMKNQRKGKFEDVDRNLLQWCTGAFTANLEGITRELLMQKGHKTAESLGYEQNDLQKMNIEWVRRFKARHNIASMKQSREAGSVPENTVNTWVENSLSKSRQKFKDEDIYNIDETGLFWQVLPDRTMNFRGQKCHGGKLSKNRVTVLVCANTTGTDKLPPIVIGKYHRPRCFAGVKQLPLQYFANKKA